jgi:hypothetical protein
VPIVKAPGEKRKAGEIESSQLRAPGDDTLGQQTRREAERLTLAPDALHPSRTDYVPRPLPVRSSSRHIQPSSPLASRSGDVPSGPTRKPLPGDRARPERDGLEGKRGEGSREEGGTRPSLGKRIGAFVSAKVVVVGVVGRRSGVSSKGGDGRSLGGEGGVLRGDGREGGHGEGGRRGEGCLTGGGA